MADSALIFGLNVWLKDPSMHGDVVDDLNTRIYKRLLAEQIEITYPKQDVYMHQVPTS